MTFFCHLLSLFDVNCHETSVVCPFLTGFGSGEARSSGAPNRHEAPTLNPHAHGTSVFTRQWKIWKDMKGYGIEWFSHENACAQEGLKEMPRTRLWPLMSWRQMQRLWTLGHKRRVRTCHLASDDFARLRMALRWSLRFLHGCKCGEKNENSVLESSRRLIGLQHTACLRRHGVFVRWPGPRPGLELPRLGRASEPEKRQSWSPVLKFSIVRLAVEMQLSSPLFGETPLGQQLYLWLLTSFGIFFRLMSQRQRRRSDTPTRLGYLGW